MIEKLVTKIHTVESRDLVQIESRKTLERLFCDE